MKNAKKDGVPFEEGEEEEKEEDDTDDEGFMPVLMNVVLEAFTCFLNLSIINDVVTKT